MQLLTQFTDRHTLVEYLHEHFPYAVQRSPEISSRPGGRTAAEILLQKIKLDRYTETRNILKGAVTHLSPYIRHGVVTLAEIRHSLLEQRSPKNAYKLLQELAWHDYYQHVYERLGNAVWQDIEGYKTGIQEYARELPSDIEWGTTGLSCIDAFAHELRETGYLHNHARMWTAAYVVHHRRVRWQAGAAWFLQHLLDGDPASNNLSWQWVASTFAAKPYYFNRENLARFTENIYCKDCPFLHHNCPFEGSYAEIAEHIFPNAVTSEQIITNQTELMQLLMHGNGRGKKKQESAQGTAQESIVWINEDNLNPYDPALKAHPHATPLFIFDETAIKNARWTLKRILFIYECLLEIPHICIYRGSPSKVLREQVSQRRELTGEKVAIASTWAVDPRWREQRDEVKKFAPIMLYETESFVKVQVGQDLRRFSRYWKAVEDAVIDGI